MSKIARIIDAVLADALAAPLKAAGYRRTGRNWRRFSSASVRVVNAQASTWNSGDEGRFTLNLGLYFRALAPLVGWGRTAERPTEADCQVRMRIGFLLPTHQDHWWAVTSRTDQAVLAAEIRAAWQDHGSPWFEQYDDLDAARPLVAEQYAYGSAAVSLALGDRADAERRFAETLAACTQRGRGELLRAWGRQHGFELQAT